ncbi:hypothetical protein J4221_03860 [Candidatus Pacearchaeota archaeon]|nr:hypothetical protein [Candidatus Pacearchaeota archaeon]
MPEEKNLDEIILYRGSLRELHEQLDSRQHYPDRFRCAIELYYITKFYNSDTTGKNPEHFLTKIKREIGKTYDGLVDVRTIILTHDGIFYAVEGTPIVRVDR